MCKYIPREMNVIDGNLGLIHRSNYAQVSNMSRADRLMRAVFADNRVDDHEIPLLMEVQDLVRFEKDQNLECEVYIKDACGAVDSLGDKFDRERETRKRRRPVAEPAHT